MRSTDAELAFHSQEILKFLRGRLPTWQELSALNEEKGYDVALTVLYRSILQAQPHSAFIRHFQSAKPGFHDFKKGKAPVEVVIVPSVMPHSRAKWGAHCDWMRKIAREMGFSTDIVETQKRESIAGNARILGDYFKKTTAEKVLLLTTGRGTAEMRFLLQKKKDAPELRKIRGWLNINGCANGSSLVENSLSKPWKRLQAQAQTWLTGEKFSSRLELFPSSALWREPMRVHERMMIVSVFGLLHSDQSPIGKADTFKRMMESGPTDGVLLAKEMMMRPGLLVPVPGLKHELEELATQGILQRLLTVMGASIQAHDQARASNAGHEDSRPAEISG